MAATSGNILDTIGALYDSLTKTEKRIATTVLSSPELLGQNSLAEIAQQFDVGEATFIRFCRTLGFKGFTDFKLQLSIELATKIDNLILYWKRIYQNLMEQAKSQKNCKMSFIMSFQKPLICWILLNSKKLLN